ncbi:hypothetical protein J2S43_004820 [Catenuloplanes nepalensis]|uniref:Uncharacterized protein n=1 Tax=Catenuloplanes nepalensis TaxID=587533 RepID=A0ABT9MYH4_9ACTN|nr:hypothetical protein [Catenuloplanes nepalensis]MDP9796308.1 hypothetical protein [Catenuloplanes nepalensis]
MRPAQTAGAGLPRMPSTTLGVQIIGRAATHDDDRPVQSGPRSRSTANVTSPDETGSVPPIRTPFAVASTRRPDSRVAKNRRARIADCTSARVFDEHGTDWGYPERRWRARSTS